MEGGFFWFLALTASLLVGMSKGGLPIVGMLSVPVLSLAISPITAVGLLLPVYVLSDLFGLYAYRHAFNGRVLAIMVPGMVVGVGIGWMTAHVVPEWSVTALVGLIGTVFALNSMLRKQVDGPPQEAKIGPGLFWGSVAGFTSFVSHTGGPPYQVYTLPLRMTKTVFAGTSTIAFAIVNAVKLIPYYYLDQLNLANLKIAFVLMPPAALAVFGGVWLVRWMPEKLFFRIVTWALLAVSLKLIYDGLSG